MSVGSASGVSGRRARPALATLCQWFSPCKEEFLPVDLSRTASTSFAQSGMGTRSCGPTAVTRSPVFGLHLEEAVSKDYRGSVPENNPCYRQVAWRIAICRAALSQIVLRICVTSGLSIRSFYAPGLPYPDLYFPRYFVHEVPGKLRWKSLTEN